MLVGRCINRLAACSVLLALQVYAGSTMEMNAPRSVVLMATRTQAGTNLKRAHEERIDSSGRVESSLRRVVEDQLASCASAARIDFVELDFPDHIGESSSRLHGVGLYAQLPDNGSGAFGRWYVAPFVAMRVRGARADGSELFNVEINEFAVKEFEEPRLTTSDFLALSADQVMIALGPFLQRSVVAALKRGISGCNS